MVDDARARRNAVVLAVAQTLYGLSAMIIITAGGLVGQMLAIDKSLATLPISLFVLGTATFTVPASLVMRRVGRRAGFMAGAALGGVGAVIATIGILLASFPVFAGAMLLFGAHQATSMYYRFAAADVASDAFKAKAISWVLAGGVAAALLAPQLLVHTQDLLAPVVFAGSFASLAAVALVAVTVLSLVDIPRLSPAFRADQGRPLGEIIGQPKFVTAVICAMVSYGMMSLVMTATPLAMIACGHSVGDAAFVVQWHAVAMFAPSFFTGSVINRFGAPRVILTGLALLAVCGVVALSGIAVEQFLIALVLLGLGWNFGFVGATTLVTETYRPQERNKVQAANDFLVFGTVASASLMSGVLFQNFGWETVNLALFPFVAVAAALMGWTVLKGRRENLAEAAR